MSTITDTDPKIIAWQIDRSEGLEIPLIYSFPQPVDNIKDNLKNYLKLNLGSDWEKVKNTQYKNRTGSKKELIKIGSKTIGNQFLKIFIKS